MPTSLARSTHLCYSATLSQLQSRVISQPSRHLPCRTDSDLSSSSHEIGMLHAHQALCALPNMLSLSLGVMRAVQRNLCAYDRAKSKTLRTERGGSRVLCRCLRFAWRRCGGERTRVRYFSSSWVGVIVTWRYLFGHHHQHPLLT